jgi:hypothetical protein
MASRRTSEEHTILDDQEEPKASYLGHDSQEKTTAGGPAGDSGSYPQLDYVQDESRTDKNEIPWLYRIVAFSMIVLFAFGSSFSESTFGPLKSTLRKELGITSECYACRLNLR